MHTKLHINISQGVVDVEGDPDLVRKVYADFKEKLLNGIALSPPAVTGDSAIAASTTNIGQKQRRNVGGKVYEKGSSNKIDPNKPKLDKNLNTSTLTEYYRKYKAKNNQEKILIFLMFLTGELDIQNPNTNQVYTCFRAANEKVPKAFAQAFLHASGRYGFIEYNSPSNLTVTVVGDNHFNFEIDKNVAELEK